MSASSIDRQILRVEQELAMPLFERHPTGLRLTAAGELLLHAANNWKKDFTRVCEQLDDLRGLRRGHVRIATIDAINRHFFSTMLKEVHKHYPNISFTLTTINNIHIQQALISGEADFGIMLNPEPPVNCRSGVCRDEYGDCGAHRPSAGQPQRGAL